MITTDKLNQLAMNWDPKPFMEMFNQPGAVKGWPGTGAAEGTGGIEENPSFNSFLQPKTGATPAQKPMGGIPPAAIQMLMPKPPQLLPPGPLPQQRQVQAPGQFQAPLQPQPSLSQILYGR